MSKVLTGSKAALKLNGVKVGFVDSVTINEENTLTDIDVLDQLEVAEHAELELLKELNKLREKWQQATKTGRFSMSAGSQTLPKDDGKWKTGPYKMIHAIPAQHGAYDILTQDDVIYNHQHRAKVLRFAPNQDSVEIEFDKGLIPLRMWVPIEHVSYAYGGRVINVQTHCPKCEVKWKEVVLARFSVWDCPSCGAKKEDHAT